MVKIELDSLSIDELAALRDTVADKLAEKVAARQAELEAELEALSRYGKPIKRVQGSAAVKQKSAVSKEQATNAA
ncbi:MAG TPA: hypothetical protein VGC77_19560 [Rhodopseudomonas sp.]|uniref:hypothetical protein n=1 Tax=Rhodopseudomonas sp. TaxID=1078 RepID=UPI002ED858A1